MNSIIIIFIKKGVSNSLKVKNLEQYDIEI